MFRPRRLGSSVGQSDFLSGEIGFPGRRTLTKLRAGEITFDWNKSGWTGVKIQARAAGTLDWSDLGTDLFSPFVDSRPLATPSTPEVREYRACYLDKETPTLDWSAVLVVTVQP